MLGRPSPCPYHPPRARLLPVCVASARSSVCLASRNPLVWEGVVRSSVSRLPTPFVSPVAHPSLPEICPSGNQSPSLSSSPSIRFASVRQPLPSPIRTDLRPTRVKLFPFGRNFTSSFFSRRLKSIFHKAPVSYFAFVGTVCRGKFTQIAVQLPSAVLDTDLCFSYWGGRVGVGRHPSCSAVLPPCSAVCLAYSGDSVSPCSAALPSLAHSDGSTSPCLLGCRPLLFCLLGWALLTRTTLRSAIVRIILTGGMFYE